MRPQKRNKAQDRPFYRGRTTYTSTDQKQLKKQKVYRRQKLSQQKRKAFVLSMGTKLKWVGVLVVAVLTLHALRIQSPEFVGLTGLSEADKAVITEVSDDYLSEGFRNYKTFFSESDYEQYLLSRASFVASVDASISFFSPALKVRIVPKKPLFAYRGISGGENAWIADDGTLTRLTDDQIFQMGQSTPTLIVRDLSDVDYQEGDIIISQSALDFMNTLQLEFALEGVDISAFRIQDNPREVEAEIAGERYILRLNVERPIQSIIDDYLQVNETINTASVTRYIDLRVPDKVFYR